MKRLSIAVLFVVFSLASHGLLAQTVTRGPYLQLPTDTGISIHWRTDTATESVVRFGTDSATLGATASVPGSRTEHVVQLNGLLPLTRYYYSIGDNAGSLAGDATYFFFTAPTNGSATPTRIWVIGDSGTAVTHPGQAIAVKNAFKAYAASSPADFMVMLGDNAYNDGTDLEYQQTVFEVYPELFRQLPVWSTLGNHDGHSADSTTQTGPYYEIFEFPTAAEVGGLASGTEAYFSWDYGDVHIVNLDSYDTDRSVNGNMMQWLESDLAYNDKPWVIAIFHHPPYTKGSHNSDTESQLVDMRQNALPILEAWGVDLVMSGHSHSYERSYLIDGHYGISTTLDPVGNVLDPGDGRVGSDGAYEKPDIIAAEHAGAVYAVAGSSGKVSAATLNHPAMYVGLVELGSLVIDIAGNQLDAVFIDETGAVLDEFSIMKTPDVQAPMIESAWAEDGTHVIVEFSERVSAASAAVPANYVVSGLSVSDASLLPGSSVVRLTTSAMTPGQAYTLTVNNVMDEAGNVIAADSQFAFDFNEQVTRSFQDGLAPTPAYDGTFDTYIRQASATTNYGAAAALLVDGDEPAGTTSDMSILLGWDVSEIPASATIDAVNIHLNTQNVGGPYYCYALRRAWDENQATWNQASAGSAWGAPGALAGSDRDGLPLCTVNTGSLGTLVVPLNADGIAQVQSWVSGAVANHGLVISDSGSTNGADFDSSESGSAMSRPKLEVTYTLAVNPPNQAPMAGFTFACTGLDCGFTDTSSDSDGSLVSWSWDFGDGNGSNAQDPVHSFAVDGTYTVSLTATDDDGAADVTSSQVTISTPPAVIDVVANADLFGAGAVSGAYTETHTDDGGPQSVLERESGGRKTARYSYLEHTWQFSLPANAMATVYANAWSGGSTDDQFRFSWSGDNVNFTPMFIVSSTDQSGTQAFALPNGTNGAVYIRVEDTDQTPGNNSLDTVFIDHLYIRTESGAGNPPDAPGGLAAIAAGTSEINLLWTDNASDENGFKVERSADGVVFAEAGTTPADDTGYADFGLSPETTYWYRVRAWNASGDSAYSNVAVATTDAPPPPTLPLAPSSLVASALGSSSASLVWQDNSNNEDDFEIARSTDGINFSSLVVLGAGTEGYTDIGLTAATAYWYQVRARNAVGNSAYSNTAQVTTDPAASISLGLAGYKDKGKHVVDLTWSGAVAANVDIIRDGAYLLTVSNSGAYSDHTGQKGAWTYTYRVCEAGTENCSPIQSITF